MGYFYLPLFMEDLWPWVSCLWTIPSNYHQILLRTWKKQLTSQTPPNRFDRQKAKKKKSSSNQIKSNPTTPFPRAILDLNIEQNTQKFMLKASKLLMPGPQDLIIQHLF